MLLYILLLYSIPVLENHC